jgi:hypothetical protein
MKRRPKAQTFDKWDELNTWLMNQDDPELVYQALLLEQQSTRRRPTFVNRIFARYNRLRALAERPSLLLKGAR